MSWGETLFLKKVIDGKKGLVAGEDVYMIIDASIGVSGEDVKQKDLFKMNVSGSFVLGIDYNSYYGRTSVKILVNGEQVHSYYPESGSQSGTIKLVTITANKNDVIAVKVACSDVMGQCTVKQVILYANVVDSSLISTI